MKGRITPENITKLEPGQVFVFGSNERGRHGKGAAKTALKWGARMGEGHGHSGWTYALPTVRVPGDPLPISKVALNVDRFIAYAKNNPDLTFLVTEVGCGLAGFAVKEIAPLFADAAHYPNVWLPARFWHKLGHKP